MSLEWFSFAGRVARVTGEAQGLGRAVAEMLAGAGILLVIADCQADTLARTAAALTRQGDQVVRVPADVTHARQVAEVVQHGLATSSVLDMLVHHAGGSGTRVGEAIEDVSEVLWNESVEAYLKSAYPCSRTVVPPMKAWHRGSIVHVSSMSAQGAFGGRGTPVARLPYAGAKAGMIGCTSQLAKALGPCGIQVNAVMPGGRLTQPDARVAQRYQGLAAEVQPGMVASGLLGRPGRPEAVAAVRLCLVSPAASYCTGSLREVHGGR
jgi:3-oxoacyl-[acyl-carrier protein] reductase